MTRYFKETGFRLDKQVYTELCHYSLVYLVEVGEKTGKPVLLSVVGVFCSKNSLRSSSLLCLANCGFLREQNAIVVEQSLVV